MVAPAITPEQQDKLRHEPASRSQVRIVVNPWGSVQVLDRTYGVPRAGGYGARRAVRKFGPALKKLAD